MRKSTVIFLLLLGILGCSAKFNLRDEVAKNVTYLMDDFAMIDRVKNLTCSVEAEAVYLYYENSTFPEDYEVDILITKFMDYEKCSMSIKSFNNYVSDFKLGRRGKSITLFLFYSIERDFSLAFPGISKSDQKQHVRFVFIFLKNMNGTGSRAEEMKWFKDLFQRIWEKNILDALVFYQGADGNLRAVTFNPFLNDFFIELNSTSGSLNDYFPDKLKDVHGMNLHILLASDELRANLNKSVSDEKKGVDYQLMHFVKKGLNATFTIVKEKNGTVENSSINYDINFNSVLLTPQFFTDNITEATSVLGRDDMRILVPRKGTASQFSNVFFVFGYTVWILIAVLLIVGSVVWYLTEKINKVPNPKPHFLYLYRIQVTQSMQYLNVPLSAQMFFGFWQLYSLVISACFTCLLISTLMHIGELENFNTIDELIDANMTIVSVQKYIKPLNEYFNVSATATRNASKLLVGVKSDKEYKKMITMGQTNYAFLHKSLETIYYSVTVVFDGKEAYHVMKDSVLPSFVCFAVKYGSWFLPGVNKLIRIAEESGLMEHWFFKSMERYKHRDIKIQNGKIVEEKPEATLDVLTLGDLQAAFYFLIIGNLLGLVVFIIEISNVKIRKIYQKWKKPKGENPLNPVPRTKKVQFNIKEY